MTGLAAGMLGGIGFWLLLAWWMRARGDLEGSAYVSPDEVLREVARLGERDTRVCRCEQIGCSAEGRPLLALRFSRFEHGGDSPRARLLVGAQIHAIEFIAGLVARRLAERLIEGAHDDCEIRKLLDAADVVVIPLLNPDGAARVWRRHGRVGMRDARTTSRGVDPNRNFPSDPRLVAEGWNSARANPRSAYHRGPHPLSEPECHALATLAARERFCAAIQLHSIGGVVYLPEPSGPDAERAGHVLATFGGPFQSRQPLRRYRSIRRTPARSASQLDPFLLDAFGTPGVTVEISRPGPLLLLPWYATRLFWWANPPDPRRWLANDVDALIGALYELLQRSGGTPVTPSRPELARVPEFERVSDRPLE